MYAPKRRVCPRDQRKLKASWRDVSKPPHVGPLRHGSECFRRALGQECSNVARHRALSCELDIRGLEEPAIVGVYCGFEALTDGSRQRPCHPDPWDAPVRRTWEDRCDAREDVSRVRVEIRSAHAHTHGDAHEDGRWETGDEGGQTADEGGRKHNEGCLQPLIAIHLRRATRRPALVRLSNDRTHLPGPHGRR